MELPYDDRFAPMTESLGFLEAEIETTAQEYTDWVKELGHCVERRIMLGTLAELLTSMLPLTIVGIRRVLWVPTTGSWTAYFDNGWRGSEADSRVGYLHRRVACRGVHAACVPHTIRGKGQDQKGRYGATMFSVYSPAIDSISGCERSVCAANDGGPWVFETYGEPYDFEDLEQYKAKRIRDRFTPEMLQDYLLHFGIDAFNPDFYVATKQKPAVMFQFLHPPYPNERDCSLEEARAHY